MGKKRIFGEERKGRLKGFIDWKEECVSCNMTW